MKYFEPKRLEEGIATNPDFLKMIETMKIETTEFCNNFHDDPQLKSEWGHHDFCKLDGGKLIFDVNRPYDHICEICGTNNKSKLLDGVWVYNYRNEAVLNIWKAAFLYKHTTEPIYLDFVYKVLGFYKDNYLKFQLHNKEGLIFENYETMKWGAGRIMPQGLNESIITIRILNALELIKEAIDPDFLVDLKVKFFDEVAKLLIPQVDKIHNISCWKNSAIGAIGFFYNEKKYLDFVFKDKYNIYNQIAKGVTNDGFWFEGSIHYNFFTLEGIINLLLFATIYEYKFKNEAKNVIEKMLKAAYDYSFDNHVLPNPNDGWPNINLKTYSYIYAIGSKIFGINSEVANLLKLIELKPTIREELPLSKPYYYENKYSLERLILAPNLDLKQVTEVPRRSIDFKDSQFGMIRNSNVNVFLKYGHNGPSHAHPDKMNIEVMINNQLLTRDLSNAGYGNRFCNEWHRVTAAHNTVVVNGMNQRSFDRGKTLIFNENQFSATAKNVYGLKDFNLDKMKATVNHDEITKYLVENFGLTPQAAQKANQADLEKLLSNQLDVSYTRTISLLEDGYLDEFVVNSNDYVTIDLFMHIEGELISEVATKPHNLGYEHNGYQHLQNVRKLAASSTNYKLSWQVGDLVLTFNTNLQNKVLFLADTYDNPITKSRQTLIIRYIGKRTKFKQIWKVEEKL